MIFHQRELRHHIRSHSGNRTAPPKNGLQDWLYLEVHDNAEEFRRHWNNKDGPVVDQITLV